MTHHDQARPTPQSILIADCGTTTTTAALFDVAGSGYRLIARASTATTSGMPHLDINIGALQAIQHISEITGRTLLNDAGQLIKPSSRVGSGVDNFTAVISCASPLNTLLVGLFDDVSLASGRHALRSGYAIVTDCFSLADDRSEKEQINTIIQNQPDLILLVGGTDGGAEQRLLNMVETVSLGTSVLGKIKRPQIIFAGNKNLRERVRHKFGDLANVQTANNVRPTLEKEHLDQVVQIVGELYEDIKINTLPGIQKIREWSNYPLIPTAQAFATITGYFSALQKSRVLGVDLGSNSTTFVSADSDKTNLTIRSDLGCGRPIKNLFSKVDLNLISHWLPFEIEQEEIKDFILNKSIYPHTIPQTENDLYLEQAIGREIIRCIFLESAANWGWFPGRIPSFSLLLARGGLLSNTTHPGQAILILLDAIQPAGIFSIALDNQGVLPLLGSLAAHDPLAVVQILEGGVLNDLGWVVAPFGKGQPGQKVLTVVMESPKIKRLEIEVDYGTIELLPLGIGQSADISLQPERNFNIGFGPGQGKKMHLQGGSAGLVIDARGRPLNFSQDITTRRKQVRQWLWDVGG